MITAALSASLYNKYLALVYPLLFFVIGDATFAPFTTNDLVRINATKLLEFGMEGSKPPIKAMISMCANKSTSFNPVMAV